MDEQDATTSPGMSEESACDAVGEVEAEGELENKLAGMVVPREVTVCSDGNRVRDGGGGGDGGH